MYLKFFLIIFCSFSYSRTDIIILSNSVGTIIDIHENRYYEIFPSEKGFKNAQIIKLSDDKYRVNFEKIIKRKSVVRSEIIDNNEFERLKGLVDEKGTFSKKDRIAMYKGMDFLRAEKIINEIEKPQFITLKYSRNKFLKGTLVKVSDNNLYVQTPTSVEFVNLENVDLIKFRKITDRYNFLKPYIRVITGLGGLFSANLYNKQRPIVLNDYGIPRKDLVRYRQLFGIVMGLIFSSEVFDAVATLLTPMESVILSEAEFDQKNIKKGNE
jgi:hypothetical protein